MRVKWSVIKQLADTKLLSIQWLDLTDSYFLKLSDGVFDLECILDKSPSDTTDLLDFETNYKPSGNQAFNAQVTTQFELNDKDLKICTIQSAVDALTGEATVQILCPGTPGTTDGRYIAGGEAFFDQAHVQDKVTKVQIIDIDNILGYGANTIVKTYHDSEVPVENQGWVIGVDNYDATGNTAIVEVETLGGYGFIPAGLYLQIVAKKDPSYKTGIFFSNVFWGKKE